MAPGLGQGDGLETRRSGLARLRAVLAGLVALAFTAAALAAADPLAMGVAPVVLAAALLSLASAFGDSWRADEAGLGYRNRFVRTWPFAPRRLGWDEIEALRVWRGKVLIVRPAAGARLVIDEPERFAELSERVVRATGLEPAAPGSGSPR